MANTAVQHCHCGGEIMPSTDKDLDLSPNEWCCQACSLVYPAPGDEPLIQTADITLLANKGSWTCDWCTDRMHTANGGGLKAPFIISDSGWDNGICLGHVRSHYPGLLDDAKVYELAVGIVLDMLFAPPAS